MYRKMYDQLIEWKRSERRKPLLLTGARQVGKTYLLKQFASREFENVIYLNLDKDRERYEMLFSGTIDAKTIVERIEVLLGIKIDSKNSIIIFDEIQEIPRALSSLKYFCEDAPEYYVAASGSFLGIALHKGTSFPVGKVDIVQLEPLDFEEFLIATGNERFLDILKSGRDLGLLADSFEELFRKYLVVGGMPEAVAGWIKNGDYAEVDKIQNAILLAYLDDMSKHADTTTTMRIRQVWNSLPAQFAKRNEKFMFNVIREGARAREYELAVEWLVDCKIVRKVDLVKVGKLPLGAYVNTGVFKLYFLDVGLFRHLAGASSEVVLNDDELFKEFNGFFVEQFVLQQMANMHQMYYWTSDATAEVDFVAEICGRVVPIEVKSGQNVKAKSLRVFRESYAPELSLRFSMLPVEYNDGLLNLPVYLAGFVDDYVAKYSIVD